MYDSALQVLFEVYFNAIDIEFHEIQALKLHHYACSEIRIECHYA